MTRRLTSLKMLGLVLVSMNSFVAVGGERLKVPGYPGYNRLLVPKTSQKIEVNGAIQPEQWRDAAEVTGFLRYNHHRSTEILPEEQRNRFMLMYDDENFYVAMSSRNFPEGAPLKTDQKNSRDQGSIVMYDHWEIQFCRTDDPGAALKKHFYKFMGNHRHSLFDQKAQPSVGQTGIEWDAGAEYATKFNDKAWDMEIAIPFKNMDEEFSPEDYETWIMWLVRAYNCQSSDFFMWGGKDWTGWDYMPRFTFHSNLVSAKLKRIGEPLDGKLNLSMELLNHSDSMKKVFLNLNVKDGQKEIFNVDKTLDIQGGKSKTVDIDKKDIPVAKSVVVTLTAWMDRIEKSRSGRGKVAKTNPIIIYQQQFSLTPKDKKYVDFNFDHVKEYRESKIDYNWDAAYIRSANAIRGYLNMDLDGIDPKFLKAETWRLSMVKGSATAFSKEVALTNKKAEITEKLSKEVGEGTWKIKSELVDADGKVVDEKGYSFRVKKSPWEGYRGGINDDFVPPPYKPVSTDGDKIRVLNRTYTLGENGLPSSIICEGEELLAKPITFNAVIGGRTVEAQGKGFKITEQKAGNVAWTATMEIGDIELELTCHMEYDGALFIDFIMKPKDGAVQVDEMNFVAEFAGFVNIIKTFRGSDYSGAGGITIGAEQKGVIWESAQSRPVKNLTGSFNPAIFIGTPDKGLWWFGKSDRGWILDDQKSATVVERNSMGNIVLKQCLINTSTTLSKPRKIAFMVQAVPAKPLPDNWREIAWGPQRIFGYGGWADGYYSFSYENPENWKIFKKWSWHDKPVYVATELIGRMTPGFSTYCGEWTGNSKDDRFGQNHTFIKHFPNKHWRNSAGIVFKDKWKERTSNYINVDMVPSLADCRVWCYEQGVKNGGLRGYWWDMNTYRCVFRPEVGFGYVREDGVKQGEFNYFVMRDMFKRMYHVAYQNGTTPEQWHYTGGVLGSFQYASWLTEGFYYMFSPSVDLIDGSPRDFWPIASGKFTGCIPQMRSNFYEVGQRGPFVDTRPARAALTLCFLNDFGAYGINDAYRNTVLDKLRKEGFFAPATKSILHWRPTVKANASFSAVNGDADILVTAYQLPDRKLLIALGNMSKVGSEGALRLKPKAFVENWKRQGQVALRDLETGVTRKLNPSDGWIEMTRIFVGGHDFKLFIVE